MSHDLVNALPGHLAQDEVEFLYNVEVLGLPARKAAKMSGMSVAKIVAPHIIQAREELKRELRGRMAITKEDIVNGYQEAVEMAKIVSDPMAMIAGWKETSRILGYDAPQKVDINIHASVDAMASQVKAMDDASLARLLGADQIIDAEFYELGTGKS